MSDADEPAICDTLGCENTPVEGDCCAKCADISLGILDNAGSDAPEGHRASDVSDEADDSLAGKDFTQAYHIAREQYGAPPSDHFITEACDEAYHKLGRINSAEGESHLPTGGSNATRACFFPAQDNIVCHSPSHGYGLPSSATARATNSRGHDGSPGRQRWNDGAHP